LRGKNEKQLAHKRPNISTSSIFNFFYYQWTFQKIWC
jgi:hypothetical protein